MPRSIYQYPRRKRTYIGDTVLQLKKKVPVWQWHDNGWIQLNADNDKVDWSVTKIDYDSAQINWVYEYDQQRIEMVVSGKGTYVSTKPTDRKYTIGGLAANTTYSVSVRALMSWGWTPISTKSFRTSQTPIPAAPTNLAFTSRTNSSIRMSWNAALRAVRYEVYVLVGTSGKWTRVDVVTGTSSTVRAHEDTKYSYKVRAINASNHAGAYSNTIRVQTGHDEVSQTGSCTRYAIPVKRTGSWRPDIKWGYWPGWPHGGYNYDVYQGYWRYTNKRYKGIVEYDPAAIQAALNKRFGTGVASGIHVTKAEIRKVKRRPEPGSGAALELQWHLAQCNVRTSDHEPAIYQKHVNDRNSADAKASQRKIKRGQTIEFLRIPRSWGEAIIKGKYGSTKVNGLAISRSDNDWNGFGYAGYLSLAEDGEGSNWDLMISGNWNIVTRAYLAPKGW